MIYLAQFILVCLDYPHEASTLIRIIEADNKDEAELLLRREYQSYTDKIGIRKKLESYSITPMITKNT